jgi:type VI secretion system protein ImpC
MTKPISFGKLDFKIVASMEEPQGLPEPETPFRILILGDFSGRVNRGVFRAGSAIASRNPLLVDRDNFDEVMARLGVEINLPIAESDSPAVAIPFGGLDDFHPDRIYERVEVFQALRQTRQRLEDPRTFAETATELQSGEEPATTPKSHEPPSDQSSSAPELPPLSKSDLLDQVLGKTEGKPQEMRPSSPASGWESYLKEIVRPYLVPDTDLQQSVLIAGVDEAIAEMMRTILHHPDFQAIEAAWRALHFLVSRLETGTELKLYLLDISKDELAADLTAAEELQSTGTYRLLVEKTVETFGGEPWSVLAGNYTFDQTREDAELLGRMAKIARQAGAPFISAASAYVLGCESLAETPDPHEWQRLADKTGSQAWEALRKLEEASYIGLAFPRLLLRLPYGAESEPTEQFDFEEMPALPEHEFYLWGNPCFACVCLLAQAFSYYGWGFRPGAVQDIEGLPLHVYQEQGESSLKPCAEVLFTERAVNIMLDKGLMPLLSFQNQDTVRLARFQSSADPEAPLAGRWHYY